MCLTQPPSCLQSPFELPLYGRSGEVLPGRNFLDPHHPGAPQLSLTGFDSNNTQAYLKADTICGPITIGHVDTRMRMAEHSELGRSREGSFSGASNSSRRTLKHLGGLRCDGGSRQPESSLRLASMRSPPFQLFEHLCGSFTPCLLVYSQTGGGRDPDRRGAAECSAALWAGQGWGSTLDPLGCPGPPLSHVTTDLRHEFQETGHSLDGCLGTLPKPPGPMQGSKGRMRPLGPCSPKTAGLGHGLLKERSLTHPHPEIYRLLHAS